MTTQLFIEKALRGTTRSKQCSSVFVDGDTVYSYGHHYPLAKIIEGKAFVNTAGYSVTTAKHIIWAKSAAAQVVGWDNVYHAPIIGGHEMNAEAILEGAEEAAQIIREQMDAKKRKDTQAYEWLQVKLDRMNKTIAAVKELNMGFVF